jgi:hypothetical protein
MSSMASMLLSFRSIKTRNHLPGHTPRSNGVSITHDHSLVRRSQLPVDRRSSIFTIVPTAEAGKRVLDHGAMTCHAQFA